MEKTVDRESPQKLYVQVYEIFRDKILSREWRPGSQIPTEDELCQAFSVSKATVRMAVAELVRDGYLRKHQGKGTFVTQPPQQLGITMKTRLTEDMFGEGVSTRKEILVKGVKKPPEDVKAHLKTEGDVFYVLCKRMVNGEPAYLEESFIPLETVPDIEEAEVCQTPLYELMQQRSVTKIARVLQMTEIAETSGEAAAVLKVENGTPVLLLHRLLIGTDGKPLAYTRLLGNGRKYKLQTELVQIA